MVKELLRHSTKATCGIMEREVIVSTKIKSAAIRTLQGKGYQIVGTGQVDKNRTKIWFIRQGGF